MPPKNAKEKNWQVVIPRHPTSKSILPWEVMEMTRVLGECFLTLSCKRWPVRNPSRNRENSKLCQGRKRAPHAPPTNQHSHGSATEQRVGVTGLLRAPFFYIKGITSIVTSCEFGIQPDVPPVKAPTDASGDLSQPEVLVNVSVSICFHVRGRSSDRLPRGK